MSNFGDRLREIRKSKNWTLDDMATVLGTSKQVLSRYENGYRSPKVTTVANYANRLGVELSALTGGNMEEDEMWEIREAFRVNPETRTLFSLAKNARPEDITAAIAVLSALKGTRND